MQEKEYDKVRHWKQKYNKKSAFVALYAAGKETIFKSVPILSKTSEYF